MSSPKSPYKEMKMHPAKILGWVSKNRKDSKKQRKDESKETY